MKHLAYLLLALLSLSAGRAAEPTALPPALRQAFERADGRLTAELRAAYLQFAEDSALAELAKRNVTIAAQCLADVRKDGATRDAVFGAFYPPDARVLENYAQLLAQLGPEFVARHRQLVLSAAVARRANGVGTPRDDAGNDADGEDDETKQEAKTPPAPSASAAAVADFLKETKLPAVDVWKDEAARAKLTEYLKARAADAAVLRDVTDAKRLFGVLKDAMVRLGQRPAAREPHADVATFFRHLVAIQSEKIPPFPRRRGRAVPWPLFPVDAAPWPLLMPLSQTLPMGEVRYIWDKAQGKTGGSRYHTYGPYRRTEERMPFELQPLAWHWNAWPALIVQGGVCGTMSTIGSGANNSLGKPSVKAAQPGHSCMMTFGGQPGAWVADIQQGVTGGPMETSPFWLFGEATAPRMFGGRRGGGRAGSEYVSGLALAMNVGLSEYVDTRIAAHLYHMLPDGLRNAHGWTLLADAMRINPFNPEPWYLLARDLPGAGPERIPDVMKMLASRGLGEPVAEAPNDGRKASASLEGFIERDAPHSVQKTSDIYFGVVRRVAEDLMLRCPMPAEATARAIFDSLKTAHGANGDWPPAAMPYRVRYEGREAAAASLERRIQRHLDARKQKVRVEAEAFKQELSSFLAALPAADRVPAVEGLRSLISEDQAAKLGPDDLLLAALDAAAKPAPPKHRKRGPVAKPE